MTPGVLPLPPPIVPLRRVTPTTLLTAKKCRLQAVWSAARQSPFLPLPAEAAVGRVIHRVMEGVRRVRVATREGFDGLWVQALDEEEERLSKSWFEKHLVPLSRSIRDYEQRRELCWIAVRSMTPTAPLQNYASQSHLHRGTEVWVETPDGSCAGRIDAVKVSKDGVELIDYKSSPVFPLDNNGVGGEDIEAYSFQLKFYAALYQARYGTWPRSLKIVANGGRSLEIPFTHTECTAHLKSAYKTLSRINCIIRSSGLTSKQTVSAQLASPTSQNCAYCSYRPVCAPYLQTCARAPAVEGRWPLDICGKVVETGFWGQNQVYLDIALEGADTKVRVINLTPNRHPALHQAPQWVFIFSLSPFRRSSDVFQEGKYTAIYQTKTIPSHG